MAKIVGLHGGAGHGKDTAIQEFTRLQGAGKVQSHSMAFADELKKAAAVVFGVDIGKFYNNKKEVCPIWGITYREMLQKFGTDFARNMIDDNFWVKKLGLKMDAVLAGRSRHHYDVIFITDVRFRNEANWIRARDGIVFQVHRPNLETELRGDEATHASEESLPLALIDGVILNNSTRRNLGGSLEDALREYQIIA